MFLIVLVYVTCYLALIERYKPSLLAMLPAFLVYFLVAGLQFDVGTDYFSYVDIFYDNERNQLYFNRNEFFFFWLNDALNKMGLPAQSLFLAISFVQASLLFIYLKKIKAYGISLWLLFFVFYVVTNIYNNQLNGLRQFVVVSAIPLLTILLFEKRYLRFLAVLAFVSFFHNTAWFVLFLAAAFLVRKAISSRLIYLFLVSAIGYLIIGVFIYELVEIILPSYSHYLLSDHADEYSILSFITKLYYLPLIFYFFPYIKKVKVKGGSILISWSACLC